MRLVWKSFGKLAIKSCQSLGRSFLIRVWATRTFSGYIFITNADSCTLSCCPTRRGSSIDVLIDSFLENPFDPQIQLCRAQSKPSAFCTTVPEFQEGYSSWSAQFFFWCKNTFSLPSLICRDKYNNIRKTTITYSITINLTILHS